MSFYDTQCDCGLTGGCSECKMEKSVSGWGMFRVKISEKEIEEAEKSLFRDSEIEEAK